MARSVATGHDGYRDCGRRGIAEAVSSLRRTDQARGEGVPVLWAGCRYADRVTVSGDLSLAIVEGCPALAERAATDEWRMACHQIQI